MWSKVYQQAINHAQLDLELRAAIPALYTTHGNADVCHYSIVEQGPDSWLFEAPNNIDVAQVDAVFAAHDASVQTAAQQDAQTDQADRDDFLAQVPTILAQMAVIIVDTNIPNADVERYLPQMAKAIDALTRAMESLAHAPGGPGAGTL